MGITSSKHHKHHRSLVEEHRVSEEESVHQPDQPGQQSNGQSNGKQSNALRQRKNQNTAVNDQTNTQSSKPSVITRKFYYRHEVSETESSDDSHHDHSPNDSNHLSSKRHKRRQSELRCAWLRRRHFLLLSLFTIFISTIFMQQSTPISELLPMQLQSRWHSIITDSTQPGKTARDAGVHAHFPIVLIPGIISTGLEVWEGEECARHHFRQRLWGSTVMIRAMLLDTRCWMRHMMLDPNTGLDPPGIKLRSSSGIEAADYFIGGFWIWAKIVENLAVIGYDTNSVTMSPFDWRLSLKHLQVRDFYYSKLKSQIELAKLSNHNRRVVLISHSMGALVIQYFMKWVESPSGGNAGDQWVQDHIESVVNIGGPMLGVAKAWSAVFSGEMKDTAELAPFLDYWRQRVVFSQADVIQMMRAIFSVPSMLLKGGNVIWGDDDGAPDDLFCKKYAVVADLLAANGTGTSFDDLLYNERMQAQLDALIQQQLQKEIDKQTHDLMYHTLNTSNSAEQCDMSDHVLEEDDNDDDLAPARSGHGIGASFADIIEDNLVGRPSRWFAARPDPEPYNSTRDSARGLFVTFEQWSGNTSTSDSASDDDCLDHCDMTLDQAMGELRKTAPTYMNFIESIYSFGFDPSADPLEAKHWSNPLEAPLPNAPNMKIFCLYGVGRETERGYFYKHQATGIDPENSLIPHWSINTSHSDIGLNVRSGVKFSDGDGTVPLLSLGYMCSHGWRHPHLNPGNTEIITREYLEVNASMAILRASTSTDHVDIMGNSELIADILRIVGVRKRDAPADIGLAEEAAKEEARKQRRIDIQNENQGKKKEEKGPVNEQQSAKESGEDATKGLPEDETKTVGVSNPCSQHSSQAPNETSGDQPNKTTSIDQQANERKNAEQLHCDDQSITQSSNQSIMESVFDDDSVVAGSEEEWVHTYHQVGERVLSCIREISEITDKRVKAVLKKHGKKVAE